jgi:predicted transcriptional regulator
MTSEETEQNQDTSELLFNLSSADRLALLSAVKSNRYRLTALSKIINASAQECSRHLSRLSEAGLISKDAESLYQITPLGEGLLSLLPGIKFLISHKSYFQSHDLSFLPRSFMERIGELEDGDYIDHFSRVLERIRSTVSGGKEYVWLIADQPIIVGNAAGSSFYSRDIPVRFIFDSRVDRKILSTISKALIRSEIRLLGEIRVAMGINEIGAGVVFPNKAGAIDFGGGFYSQNSIFRSWCSDLFQLYWSQSTKIQ